MRNYWFILICLFCDIAFSQSTSIDYLIVAGGGGGASGGGGGGGVLHATNYSIPVNSNITITVGAGGSSGSGGSGSSGANVGGNGGNSSISSAYGTITAIGGGGGGNSAVNGGKGADGGSGGGGSYDRPSVAYSAGTAGQGNRGGRSDRAGYGAGGGGGGAGAAGSNAPTTHLGGPGGDGIQSTISGNNIYYGGGGGGGVNHNCNCSVNNGGGQGGQGGGGNGSSLGYGNGNYNNGTAGNPNTGGGGGGTDPESTTANAGGSGIVIIRYLGTPKATGGNITEVDGSTIHTFTSIGNTLFNYRGNPEIQRTQISINNSIVSVTFSEAVYGGTANATSTLEVSDFTLNMSGGSASLTSATPSSINVSGTTIGLGVPLTGTPDGSELLTVLPASNNSIFSVSGDTVSTTQTTNTTELTPNIITDNLLLYLDASNTSSYPGTGTVWYDLSGNNNDFNLNGPSYNSSDYFDFDGTNDYAKTVSTLDLSQYDYITVQINMLSENTNKVELTFEHSENWNTNIGGFGLANQCGGSTYINNLHHTNHDRAGIYRNYEANILNDWHQQTNIFSSVEDSSGRLTYLDGNLLNYSVQPTGSYPTGTSTSNSLSFGNYHFYISSRAGSNYFFNGKVKSILIYGTNLSSSQINQNYDALNDIPPTDINLSTNTISETASIGSVIGTLSATDSDTTINNLTFSLADSGDAQDDDNGSFTISGTSLLTSTTLDYETKTSYNIYVNVSDGTTNYAKAFTVSVTNILEPITDLGFEVASIVTDGLILHLDASNSNSYSGSGNTWYDISGNNNHGTLNGPTFSNTGLKHFVFNGTDDVTSLNLSNYSDLTFEFWFYDNRTSGQRDLLTYNGNAGSFTFRNMNHFRTDGNGLSAAQYPTSLVSNQWVRFVYVKNTKIFINSTKTNISSGSDRTYGQLKIGDARSDVGQHWDGKIALVRIYNRSLTDQEIEKNYEVFDKVVNNNQQLGTSSSTVSVDEEVSAGTLVANLTATDSDTTSFTFSLVAGDGTNA